VILAGRRINNNMGPYIAQKVVKLLIEADVTVKGARVGVLGLTFKEDCTDIRNSKVPGIVHELASFGIEPMVHDPVASPAEAQHEYGLRLSALEEMTRLDALVLAVSHRWYLDLGQTRLSAMIRDGGALVDVKSALEPGRTERGIRYWSL
jgi:UDP-N-acetyl-D-galactosamine dehydrogenase